MPVVAGGQRERGKGRVGAAIYGNSPKIWIVSSLVLANRCAADGWAHGVCPTTPERPAGGTVADLYTAARSMGAVMKSGSGSGGSPAPSDQLTNAPTGVKPQRAKVCELRKALSAAGLAKGNPIQRAHGRVTLVLAGNGGQGGVQAARVPPCVRYVPPCRPPPVRSRAGVQKPSRPAGSAASTAVSTVTCWPSWPPSARQIRPARCVRMADYRRGVRQHTVDLPQSIAKPETCSAGRDASAAQVPRQGDCATRGLSHRLPERPVTVDNCAGASAARS